MHASRAAAACQILCAGDLYIVFRGRKDGIHRGIGIGGITFGHPDLGAIHHGQPDGRSMGVHLDRATKPVMVCDPKGCVLKFSSTFHQFTRPRRPIEEREVRVAMQFGVTSHPPILIEHMFEWKMFSVFRFPLSLTASIDHQ
jgi:hypothetical protein